MNPYFEIKNRTLIYDVLDNAEYGTLALSVSNMPYVVPVNFVRIDNAIFFHGALKNKKMRMLEQNPNASFSVVKNYALIDSDFSSTEGLACPATQFFKSVTIEGLTSAIESRVEKAKVFEALMEKLQPKGGYIPFSSQKYNAAIKTTAVVKLEMDKLTCKFKFGQHLSKERFDMIVSNLLKRGTPIDMETVKLMKALKRVQCPHTQ